MFKSAQPNSNEQLINKQTTESSTLVARVLNTNTEWTISIYWTNKTNTSK